MKDIKLYLKTQNRYMFIYTYRALINFEHHLNWHMLNLNRRMQWNLG